MKTIKKIWHRLLLFSFFVFIHVFAAAQTIDNSDSLIGLNKRYPFDSISGIMWEFRPKLSVKNAAIINAGIYGGSMAGLYAAWYSKYPQSRFHTFDDWAEWKQMDKIGHTYSAYTMGLYSMELWKLTNLPRKKKIWIGGLSGAAYQTVIETLDGFSSQWGWSWGDIGANMLGSAALIAQELAWNEQKIQFKTSFHRASYNDPMLQQRASALFGKSSAERFLKDYNGQTYWLSGHLKSIFPHSDLPEWLEISIGTGADGLYGARENIARDSNGNIAFDRSDIPRIRQWYLAPDIDLTKIKTRKKFIRTALFVLNALKFPAPALELSASGLKWHWLYF